MDQKVLVLLLMSLKSALCDVSSAKIPPRLHDCLTERDSNFELSDDQVSTTCLLEYQWENREHCGKVSIQTFNWLYSLANESIKSSPKRKRRRSHTKNAHHRVGAHHSHRSPTPRQRREYRTLTEAERNTYHRAINKLKEDKSVLPNKYDALAIYHRDTQNSAHGGVAFAGWHRFYLVLYELALQEQEPSVMLPYLDTTLDIEMSNPVDSIIFTDTFMGNSHGVVDSGPFGHWDDKIERSVQTARPLRVRREHINEYIRESRDQGAFVRVLENAHNNPHVWVGGHMLDLDRAPFDPIFYMHHAFVDCVWEQYRDFAKNKGENPEIYPPTNDDLHDADTPMVNLPPLNGVNLTNADGYKNIWVPKYYTCAPLPSCGGGNNDCGSDWLECDIFSGKCVSKGSSAALPSVTDNDIVKVKESISIDNTSLSIASAPSTSTLPKMTGEKFYRILKDIKTPTNKHALSVLHKRNHCHKLRFIYKVPDFARSCIGKPIENSFRKNCCDKNSDWSFMPIKIIHLRHGDINYSSHSVKVNGKVDYSSDLYSWGKQLDFMSNVSEQCRAKNQKCKHDESGLVKILISSYGLNYNGIYRDFLYVDNRHSVSSEISYIGVKKPVLNETTKIFVTATDECGIACQPLIISREKNGDVNYMYKKVQGAVEITSTSPVYHCDTPRGAEAKVWTANGNTIPVANDEKIPLVFYCDYRHNNPWCKSQG